MDLNPDQTEAGRCLPEPIALEGQAIEDLDQTAASVFVQGGGTMGKRLRAFLWENTPLGPIGGWPTALRVAVDQFMSSRFPTALCWGPELTTIHNDAFVPILGRKPPALGRSFKDVWAEAWGEVGPIAARALAGQATFIEDFKLEILRDDEPEAAYFTFCYSPVFDADGRVAGLLDTVIETTSKVQNDLLEQRVRDRMHSMLLTMPGFAAVLQGPEHQFAFCNQAMGAITGDRVYLGRPAHEVFAELRGQGLGRMLRRAYKDGVPTSVQAMPLRFRGEAGPRYLDVVVDPIRSEGQVDGVFVSGYDVTDRIRAQAELLASKQQLQELAATDALTGLANRRRLTETLERELRRAQRDKRPLALVLLDIDRFKDLNDTHGHPAGDAVLRELGALLNQFAQRGSDLAARWGGEEFVLLLSNTDARQAQAMAERLRSQVQSSIADPAGQPVTVSLGVATTTAQATGTQEQLIAQADAALYRAKREGRNRVVTSI